MGSSMVLVLAAELSQRILSQVQTGAPHFAAVAWNFFAELCPPRLPYQTWFSRIDTVSRSR